MDILALFKMVADLFIKFWSINMYIGKYTISVGAVVVFCLAIGLIIKFMRGISV